MLINKIKNNLSFLILFIIYTITAVIMYCFLENLKFTTVTEMQVGSHLVKTKREINNIYTNTNIKIETNNEIVLKLQKVLLDNKNFQEQHKTLCLKGKGCTQLYLLKSADKEITKAITTIKNSDMQVAQTPAFAKTVYELRKNIHSIFQDTRKSIHHNLHHKYYNFLSIIIFLFVINGVFSFVILFLRKKSKTLLKKVKHNNDLLNESQEVANLCSWQIDSNMEKMIFSDNVLNLLNLDKLNISKEKFFELIHPEDIQRVKDTYKNAVENKKIAHDMIYRIKKGRYYLYINGKAKHFYDKEGNYLGSNGTLQDVTLGQINEYELKKLNMIIENSPISISITDKKGNIIYVNSHFCSLTGYNKEEVMNKHTRLLKSGFTAKEEYKKMWKTIQNKKIWNGILKNKKKNGEYVWVMQSIYPILDSKDNITNFLAIKKEITQEVHLKEKLKDQQEIMIAQSQHAMMGEMIGMIAHQWRQPITVIAMSANNMLIDLELGERNDANIKEENENILKQTDYLSKTINDFRNFFKPDKEKEEVYINALLEEVMNIIGKSLENNLINVIICNESNIKITTYSRELLQVFINILKNAKEALVENTESNRHIDISTKETNENIIICFCDNGGGVEEDLKMKIFEPYFSTKDVKVGTGLGLYMSKTIIEKHLKGTIKVSNKHDGACFEITLPK